MADDNAQAQDPNPALKSLDVMVGTWDLKGRESDPDGDGRSEADMVRIPRKSGSFFVESDWASVLFSDLERMNSSRKGRAWSKK